MARTYYAREGDTYIRFPDYASRQAWVARKPDVRTAVKRDDVRSAKATVIESSVLEQMPVSSMPAGRAIAPFAISKAGAERLGVEYVSPEEAIRRSAHFVQPFDALWRRDNERRRQSQAIPEYQRRAFRNEQRNIGRDIAATEREMSKLPEGSSARGYLDARLRNLQVLRDLMRQYQDTPQGRVYNSRSTRLEAYAEYLQSYKGRANLNYQREKVVPLKIPDYPDSMMARLERKVGVSSREFDLGQPALEDLYNEYVMALRQQDSPRARAILRRMQNLQADRYYRDGRMTNQTAGLR